MARGPIIVAHSTEHYPTLACPQQTPALLFVSTNLIIVQAPLGYEPKLGPLQALAKAHQLYLSKSVESTRVDAQRALDAATPSGEVATSTLLCPQLSGRGR